MTFMVESDLAAILTGVISAVSAVTIVIITYMLNKRNDVTINLLQAELETKKADLELRNKEEDAKRSYEYGARDRLYSKFERLSFQLVELSEIAARRIRGLAREAREGHLESGGWYSSLSSAHMRNATYRLLAPLVISRIMQQQLTSFDITLDKDIESRHLIGKILYWSFTHDRRLANPTKDMPELKLDYYPSYGPAAEWSKENLAKSPEIYTDQGIYHQSKIDAMLDRFIKPGFDNVGRIMTFSEFEDECCKEGEIQEPFTEIGNLLLAFHPKTRPVLWRIFILQALLHEALKEIYEKRSHFVVFPEVLRDFSPTDFDWRKSEKEATYEAVELPFKAVKRYLEINWKQFGQTGS